MNPKLKEILSRNIILSEIGEEGQRKLLESRVLVIGAGGLGHPALQYLAAAGIGYITVVDGDRVQLSNLNRQTLFSPDLEGRQKVDIISEKLNSLNPFISIETIPQFLDYQLAKELIPKHDVILDCSDNFATRYLVNDACTYFQKPLVSASVERFQGQLAAFNIPLENGEWSGTYRCLFPHPPSDGETGSCRDVGVIGAAAGIMGSWQALEAVKILLNLKGILANQFLVMDFLTNTIQTLTFKRDEQQVQKSLDYFEKGLYQSWECQTVPFRIIDGVPSIQAEDLERFDFLPEFEKILLVRDGEVLPQLPFPYETINMKDILQTPERIHAHKQYLFFCPHGHRSASVVFMLRDEFQMTNVYNVTGGWSKLVQDEDG